MDVRNKCEAHHYLILFILVDELAFIMSCLFSWVQAFFYLYILILSQGQEYYFCI